MVRWGYDCKSAKKQLPTDDGSRSFDYVYDCAKACHKEIGCKYFSIGWEIPGWGAACWWKKTATANCTEGWEWSFYSFFKLISMLNSVIVIV